MKYAVVKIGGTQYKVSEGEEVVVDKLPCEEKKPAVFSNVLLVVDDKKIKIGTPLVEGTKVKATVLEQFKGKKIRVATYKAKSRYRRVKGFRPQLTRIKIEKIVAGKTPNEKLATTEAQKMKVKSTSVSQRVRRK